MDGRARDVTSNNTNKRCVLCAGMAATLQGGMTAVVLRGVPAAESVYSVTTKY